MPPLLSSRSRPQDWGRLPWLAPFLRRAFFLRRRFEDIATSQGRCFLWISLDLSRRARARLPRHTRLMM
ncbi:hypothetical protein C1N81_40540 [Streptomyces sp. SGAir0957]